jgi:prolyl-tRNA editing enzyme YbaK/EbsC (Cys-tRNA(Pro) deacylase)
MENPPPDRLKALRSLLDDAKAEYCILANSIELISPEDGVSAGFGVLADMAPTFVLKTEAGCMAAVIGGDRRLSYKKIKKALSLRDVSLASPELTFELTGARVGNVSPVNPGLPTLMDERLLDRQAVYGGCGIPLHTLKINPVDLADVTGAKVFDITESKAEH